MFCDMFTSFVCENALNLQNCSFYSFTKKKSLNKQKYYVYNTQVTS